MSDEKDIAAELAAITDGQVRHARWVAAFRSARDDGLTLEDAAKVADAEVKT